MQQIYFNHFPDIGKVEPQTWNRLKDLSRDKYIKAFLDNYDLWSANKISSCLIAGFGSEKFWERTAGILGYSFDENEIWLSMMMVDEEFSFPKRKERTGTRLIEKLIEIENPKVITLESKPRSEAFWLKKGFHKTGEIREGFPIYKLER